MIGRNVVYLATLDHEDKVVAGLYANVEVLIGRKSQRQADVPTEKELLEKLDYENSLLGDVNYRVPGLLTSALRAPTVYLGTEEDWIIITATAMLSMPNEPKNGICLSANPAVTFYSGQQKSFGEAFAIAFPPVAMVRETLTTAFGHLVPAEVLEELILTWTWDVRGLDLS